MLQHIESLLTQESIKPYAQKSTRCFPRGTNLNVIFPKLVGYAANNEGLRQLLLLKNEINRKNNG